MQDIQTFSHALRTDRQPVSSYVHGKVLVTTNNSSFVVDRKGALSFYTNLSLPSYAKGIYCAHLSGGRLNENSSQDELDKTVVLQLYKNGYYADVISLASGNFQRPDVLLSQEVEGQKYQTEYEMKLPELPTTFSAAAHRKVEIDTQGIISQLHEASVRDAIADAVEVGDDGFANMLAAGLVSVQPGSVDYEADLAEVVSDVISGHAEMRNRKREAQRHVSWTTFLNPSDGAGSNWISASTPDGVGMLAEQAIRSEAIEKGISTLKQQAKEMIENLDEWGKRRSLIARRLRAAEN